MNDTNTGLNFPATFCCNCGDTNCMTELQDARVTRYYGIGGIETTFQLPVPVCANCRKSTRRRPSGWFARFLVWVIVSCVVFGGLIVLGYNVVLPAWMVDRLFMLSALVALVVVVGFYRLRRPTPPQTSFYQPVRIRSASLSYRDGVTQVAFLKIAFTNHEYLNVFATANRAAIDAKTLAVVKA